MKLNKTLSLVLALLLSFSFVLSGCGKSKDAEVQDKTEAGVKTEDGTKTTETQEETVELTMAFVTFGTTPADMKLVEDEINKISVAKINAKVKLLPISIGSYNDQINLMLSSGESLDLLSFFSNNFPVYYAKGQLLPLDKLLAEDGQGIVEAIGEDYLKAGVINGEQFGITTNRDLAIGVGYVMRQDIVDKYGIDVKSIKTLDDVEAVLKLVKEKEADLVPIVPSAVGSSIIQRYSKNDRLGDENGVLTNYGAQLKVENFIETQEYADLLAKVRGWYKAGYVLEDATTTQEAGPALLKAGRGFSYIASTKPGFEQQEERMTGIELAVVELLPAQTSTSVVQTIQWGIPLNCENPEKAMQFLNLMYSDSDIANLFSWGIEGKHYVVTDGNIIDYPAGVDATTTGYGLNMGWQFGNQFITYVWKGDDPELWTKMKDFNVNAKKSSALGYTYDVTNVKNEVASCTNVVNQYRLALECGVVDLDEVLPQYIKALKEAGIEKIITEKQKQLDAWASQQ